MQVSSSFNPWAFFLSWSCSWIDFLWIPNFFSRLVIIAMCHRFSPSGVLSCTTHLSSTTYMCGHHLLTQQVRHSVNRRLCVSCRTQKQIMTMIRLSFSAKSTTLRVAFCTCMRKANCKCSEICLFLELFKTC